MTNNFLKKMAVALLLTGFTALNATTVESLITQPRKVTSESVVIVNAQILESDAKNQGLGTAIEFHLKRMRPLNNSADSVFGENVHKYFKVSYSNYFNVITLTQKKVLPRDIEIPVTFAASVDKYYAPLEKAHVLIKIKEPNSDSYEFGERIALTIFDSETCDY